MPRRNKGKGKAEDTPAPPRDQPPEEKNDADLPLPIPSPAAIPVKPALTVREIHMNRTGLLHQVTPAGQVKGTSLVSTTVINIKPGGTQRPQVASSNTFDSKTLV